MICAVAMASPIRTERPFYRLFALNCSSERGCSRPFPEHTGAFSANTADHVDLETGAPFPIESATGPTYYGSSAAGMSGDSIRLVNRVQMANFDRWSHAFRQNPTGWDGPARAT